MQKTKVLTVSMADELYNRLVAFCEEYHVNRSALVSNLINEYLLDIEENGGVLNGIRKQKIV